MSYVALNWAWEIDLPSSEKFLLVALADASNDGGICWQAQRTLAKRVGTTDRTVRENLKRLEERGLIAREASFRENGSRTSDTICLQLPAAQRADPPEESSPSPRKPATPPPGSPLPDQIPQLNLNGVSQSVEGHELPAEMLADAEALLIQSRKVDRRKVTEREMLTAAHALAELNRLLERNWGLGQFLTTIVMRIRDRPTWDAAAHVRLIQSAVRLRWWERSRSPHRLTPATIYGEQSFERVIEEATAEKAGTLPESKQRYTRKGGGERESPS